VGLKDEIEVKDGAVAADLAVTGDVEDAQAAGAVVPEAEAAVVVAEAIRGSAAICRHRSTRRTGRTSRLQKRQAQPRNRICRRSCYPANLWRSTERGPLSR
jgi:hypothetical protein